MVYYDNSIANCSINGISLYPFHSSTSISDSTFANCQDSAIYASLSSLYFTGSVNLINNTNNIQYGGALYLDYSTVSFVAPANVTFFNNSALYHGGAVFVEETQIIGKCIFLFNDTNGTLQDPGIHLYFDYSYAGEAGNILYGGNIEGCSVDCSLATHYCLMSNRMLDILNATTYLGNNNGNMISSDPFAVLACSNNTASFDIQPPVSAYPGQTRNISIITIGNLWNLGTSPSPVAYYICDTTCVDLYSPNCATENCTNPSFNNVQQTKRYCTNYTYQVTGRDNLAYSKIIWLFPITSNNTYLVYRYGVIINVNQCPVGFRNWNTNAMICSADDVLTKYNISSDINTLTVIKYGTIWVGSYSNNVLAVHLHCPYDYCNTTSITFRIEDEQDNQCNNNRRGVLCGECQPNMSAMFGSTRCMACSGQQHLWLLIAFSIMGVALVTILFLLNCTVSVGTINGLILYANIITPGILNHIFIPDDKRLLFVFISWLNLNLGIDICFYHGMDTFAKTWLQFVFPVYILLLTGAFIFASRWSSRLAHLCRQNAVAVLATLILLTYTNILQTVITVFSPTKLDIGNSTADNPQVWLADGNVPYAQGRHVYILIAAIIVTVTFLIPYTIILLLAPRIQAKSHWKIFSWINKLKPFLDAYQAPFKDQYRYWPGVLLMVRVILYAVFTSNESNDINVNLLAIIIILCFYTVVATSLSVYKYWHLGILESFFVINLVFISCTILYLNTTIGLKSATIQAEIKLSQTQANVVITSTGMSYVGILGILIYHLYTQLKGSKFALHILRKFKRNTAPLVHIGSVVEPTSWVHSDDFNESREPLLEDN